MPNHTNGQLVWFGCSIQNASETKQGRRKGRKREKEREERSCKGQQWPAEATGGLLGLRGPLQEGLEKEGEREGNGEKERQQGGYWMAKSLPVDTMGSK